MYVRDLNGEVEPLPLPGRENKECAHTPAMNDRVKKGSHHPGHKGEVPLQWKCPALSTSATL